MDIESTIGATSSTRKAERREDSAFGKIAVEMKILTRVQLDRCLAEQQQLAAAGTHIRLGKLLVNKKFISTKDFMLVLDRQNKTILTCPSCAAQYNVRAQPPGKRLRCKHCKEVLTIPSEIETLTVRDTLEGAARSDTRLEAQNRTFGNYIVLEEIARGGMGIVFRAKQKGFDREVALKVLKRDRISSEEHLQRFYREAQLAGRLTHPNIVAVYEVGECEGEPFFAMAHVKGQSLEETLRQGALPKSRALELIETISQAIHYAHEQGIVHRDLKPGNILIDEDGRPQLTDFGLAKHLEGQSLTQSGIDIGTPHYMSPEQVLGQVELIDERSDIYSLGVMLYQVMTRRLPFGGKSAIEIYHKILNLTPARPTSLKRGLPRELDVVCEKAMAREPGRRYQTAAAFAEDVRRLRTGTPIAARPPRALVRLYWTARRHQWACVGAVFALLLALLGVGLAFKKNAPRPPTKKPPLAKQPPSKTTVSNTTKPPAARSQSQQAELLILKAETAFKKEQYDQARAHLQEALKLAPRHFKIHFLLARAHEVAREGEKATAAYRKCLSYNPAYWLGINHLALNLFRLDKTREARAEFSRLIAMSRKLPKTILSEAYRMRGRCNYHFKEDEAATFDFERALQLNPKNFQAHHWLGLLYFAHSKLFGPAKQAFDRALAINRSYVPSLLFRGACSAYLQDFDAAFIDFSTAYDLDPQWVHEFIEMGLESDYDAKRYEVDVAETKKFLSNLKTYVALMSTQQKMGYKHGLYMGLYSHYTRKYAEAVQYFNKAISGAPDQQKRRLYIFRGLSLDMLGKHEQAVADYTRALATKPNDVFGRLHRSTSYLKLGQFEKARTDLERVSREDPGEVRAPLNLGMIAFLTRKHMAAQTWLTRALKISPSDSRCFSLLAWFRCQAPAPYRNLEEADQLARRALRENRGVALSWGIVGLVLEAQGRSEEATAHYQRALKAKPSHWYFTVQYYQKLLNR